MRSKTKDLMKNMMIHMNGIYKVNPPKNMVHVIILNSLEEIQYKEEK